MQDKTDGRRKIKCSPSSSKLKRDSSDPDTSRETEDENFTDCDPCEDEVEYHYPHCSGITGRGLDKCSNCDYAEVSIKDIFQNPINNDDSDIDTDRNSFELKELKSQHSEDESVSGLCDAIRDLHFDTEEDLQTKCNIINFDILEHLTQLLDEVFPARVEDRRQQRLTTRERVILTTAKLKLDVTFSELADLLENKATEDVVREIFLDTVKKMSVILRTVIRRAPKEEILRNIPKVFRKFSSTTSVLSCTEISVEKPDCQDCSAKLLSKVKHDHTVKFMTEATPAGLIVCVSKSFGGCATDECIFNQTGTIQYLQPGRDIIMVEDGFSIDDECRQKGIDLIRLSSWRNQALWSGRRTLRNHDIDGVRIHFDRMKQRISEFKILTNKLPWCMIQYIEEIFTVCCGLFNLGRPIFEDDEF